MKLLALLVSVLAVSNVVAQTQPRFQLFLTGASLGRDQTPRRHPARLFYTVVYGAKLFDSQQGIYYICQASVYSDDTNLRLACVKRKLANQPNLKTATMYPLLYVLERPSGPYAIAAAEWFVNQTTGEVTLCKGSIRGGPPHVDETCASVTPQL